jgi:hypothetical protein
MNTSDIVRDFQTETISVETIRKMYELEVPLVGIDPNLTRIDASLQKFRDFVEFAFENTDDGGLVLRSRPGYTFAHAVEIVKTYEPFFYALGRYPGRLQDGQSL